MKKFPRRPLLAALSLALAGFAHADEAAGPKWSFSGFGTLGAAHTNEKNADFVGGIFQPNGVGHSRSTATTVDSKLGVQVGAVFNDTVSAVVQVVSQYQYDSSYTPQIEWANVKFKVTDNLSVRLGRIAAPSYLMSESRFVGYAHTWVRPPQEVYSILPITSNDGVDATYRQQFGSVNNTLQAYYGGSKVKISSGEAESKPNWGINNTVEMGSLTLRAGYSSLKVKLDIESLKPLYAGMQFFGETDMLAKYDSTAMKTSAIALGALYDPGDWFVMSEFVDYRGQGFLSNSRSWYAAGGYRIGKFTPYAIYSTVKADIEEETQGGFLNGGINTALYSFTPTQHTTALGLRFDAMKNVAFKLQYDRLKTGDMSNGRLMPYPGFVQGSSVSVVSLAADFVF
jgi:hypothetical protein